MYAQPLTREQALQKLKHYCGYQERCHKEVREKLYSLGVRKAGHDEIIATLIEQDYLNEERFAVQFAGGKARLKQWGKRKILQALKERQVSEYCIKKAMKELDTGDYDQRLEKLASRKFISLKGEHYLVRKKKTMNYLIQKGYEPAGVMSVVEKLAAKK